MLSKRIITIFIIIIAFIFISNLSSYSRNLAEDEQLIKVGVGAYKDGLFDISEKQLSIFLKEYSNHPKILEVYYILGKSLLLNGKLNEARSIFLKIQNEFKNFEFLDHIFFWLGYIDIKLGNLEESKKNLLILVKNFPKFELIDYAYYLLGIINLKSNRFSQAENYFKKSIQLSKNKELLILSSYWLAIALFKQQNYELSTIYFKRIIQESNPIYNEYYKNSLFLLGDANLKLGNFSEAKSNFKSFSDKFKNDPLLPYIIFRIGYCEYRLNNIGEASRTVQFLQESYKELPIYMYTRYLMGRILNFIDDHTASIKEINFILNKTEELNLRSLSLLILFWNYLNLGQIEESNKIFQRIQKLNHFEEIKYFSQWLNAESLFYGGKILDSIPYYFNIINSKYRERALYKIAIGYFFENKFRDAITNLDIFLLEFPNSNHFDEALFIKGESLIKLGLLDQALETFNHLYEKKKNFTWLPIALAKIGSIYQLKMEDEKAIDIYKKIIYEYPNHPISSQAAVKLGNIFFKKKNMSDAIIYFTQVLKGNLSELFGHAYFAIGEVLFMQGKYDKAKKSFEDALQYLKPDSLLFFLTQLEIGNIQRMWGNYKDAKRTYQIIINKSKDDDIKKAAKELLNYIESF